MKTAILFIILGIAVKYGKMYFLIAGYNTMSKEEKLKYNIDGIASVFRNGMFGMAFAIIGGNYIAKWMDDIRIATIISIVSVVIGILYLLIRTNSAKFKIDNN